MRSSAVIGKTRKHGYNPGVRRGIQSSFWIGFTAIFCLALAAGQEPSPGSPLQSLRECPAYLLPQHQPASQSKLSEVTLQGNLHTSVAEQNEIAAALKGHNYSTDLQVATKEIEELARTAYQNHGYFRVKVDGYSRVVGGSPASPQLAASLYVEEGQQYRLKKITFRNNRAFANYRALRSLFPISDGQTFSRQAMTKGLEELHTVYRELGYLNFTFIPDTRFDEVQRTISLEIDFHEGMQFYTRSIDVIGMDRRIARRLLADAPLKVATAYNERLATMTLEHFSSVSTSPISAQANIRLEPDERSGTVAVIFDFRPCRPQ